jgi:prepilin-type N-terminal cleavage/methylation domain-containing protein/prepilin-type processing-associated H-X9-DG protein
MKQDRTYRFGFTLIELLVVISIIAILAAILFPIFLSVKNRATQVKCLANLNQLGKAVIMYCGDNNERFPTVRISESIVPERNWVGAKDVYFEEVYIERGSLWKYVKTRAIFRCPSDINKKAEEVYDKMSRYSNRLYAARNYPISYSMNYLLSNKSDSSIPRLKNVLVFIHESRKTINDGDFAWGEGVDMPDDVHYNGTTVAYADGHTQWQSKKQLEAAKNKGVWSPVPGHWVSRSDGTKIWVRN